VWPSARKLFHWKGIFPGKDLFLGRKTGGYVHAKEKSSNRKKLTAGGGKGGGGGRGVLGWTGSF